MTYEQLTIAIHDALRQGEPARCLVLLDQFIQTAHGVDLGRALSDKAGYLMVHDEARSVEALSLIDDALAFAADSPDLQMTCVIRGLGLCYNTGDTERARRYESSGHELLQRYPDNANLASLRPLFYTNLAVIATLRQEPAQAYWHLVQATKWLHGEEESSQTRSRLFRTYFRTADVSLDMNRPPEAEDALNKALLYATTPDDQFACRLVKARYLLCSNQPVAARQLLSEVSDLALADAHPHYRVVFHLTSSHVAQALGDVRGFHFHLARAQDQALDHRLDHLLARIQRVMRTPARLEAAK